MKGGGGGGGEVGLHFRATRRIETHKKSLQT